MSTNVQVPGAFSPTVQPPEGQPTANVELYAAIRAAGDAVYAGSATLIDLTHKIHFLTGSCENAEFVMDEQLADAMLDGLASLQARIEEFASRVEAIDRSRRRTAAKLLGDIAGMVETGKPVDVDAATQRQMAHAVDLAEGMVKAADPNMPF